MGSNANLWVLDFLLEADGLDDTLIKHFHDVNASQFEELPSNTQARLMLRVLRDAPAQPTGIAEAALGALNMLKNLADHLSEGLPAGSKIEALKPSLQLFVDVKTELVMKSLRGASQGEHPKVTLDTFFVPLEQGGTTEPLELERRTELLNGLDGPEEAQQLLAKYPVEQVNHSLLSFVAEARAALGPNMLKMVEKDVNAGRYDPYLQFQPPPPEQPAPVQEAAPKGKGGRAAGPKRKRSKGGTTTTEEDAAGMLANMSQSNATLAAAGGQDPLAQAVQVAQTVTADPSERQDGGDGADGTPRPALQPLPQGTLALTPTDMPASPQDAAQANAKPPGQPARRRNGRWSEDETNFLVRMVREKGKGKWKRILEEGGEVFQNRSQVDLKDKWRNLERQGVVGPHDLPPQPMQQIGGQVQILGPALIAPDGTPLTQEHYAQMAAHYAQLAAAGQQSIPAELLQHHIHHIPQLHMQQMHAQLPPLQQQQQQPQQQQQQQGELAGHVPGVPADMPSQHGLVEGGVDPLALAQPQTVQPKEEPDSGQPQAQES